MKNTLLIFFLSFTTATTFAQQKLSRADSLVLAQVVTLGKWTGTFITDKNGRHVGNGDAPHWPINALIDSFAEKSMDVKGVFDFINEHAQLLYKYVGNDLYFIAITKKEVVGIIARDGKPEIMDRHKRDDVIFYEVGHRYIKNVP